MPPKRKAKVGTKSTVPIPRSISELEQVLCAMLGINVAPDQLDATIRQATTTLNHFIKEPTSVIALFHRVGMKDSRADTRQLACVLLTKNLAKFWRPLQKSHIGGQAQADAAVCRETIMTILHSGEAPAQVLHSLSYLTSIIARLDLPRNRWPTLVEWLLGALGSPNTSHVEASLRILYSILESSAGEKLEAHYGAFYEAFKVHIGTPATPIIRYRALLALHSLLGNLTEEEHMATCLQQLIPPLLQAIPHVAHQDDTDSLKSIVKIFTSSVALEAFLPFAMSIFQTLYPFTLDTLIDLEIRDQIVTLFVDFIQIQPLLMTQPQTLPDGSTVIFYDVFIQVGFGLILEDDEFAFSLEENTPQKCGIKIIEEMFKFLPRELVFTSCVQRFVQYVFSANPLERKTAYVIIMFCAQSSPIPTFSDSVVEVGGKKGTLLEMGIECACHALATEQDPIVQHAACLALTYLGEELSPIIEQNDLFEKPLQAVLQGVKTAQGKFRTQLYMVLDTLCESAGKKMIPLLGELMTQLNIQLSLPELTQQESAITAITSIATSVDVAFIPYFAHVVPIFSQILQAPHTDELQVIKQKALVGLSACGLAVGPQNWSEEIKQFIMSCIQNAFTLFTESELTEYAWCSANAIFLGNIMSALASVDQTSPEMLGMMSKTFDSLFRVLRSLAGVHFKNRNIDAPTLAGFESDDEDDLAGGDEEDDEEGDLRDEDQDYYFDTDSLDAKASAMGSFSLLLQNLGPAFQQLVLEEIEDDASAFFADDEDDEADAPALGPQGAKEPDMVTKDPVLRLHHVLLEASGYFSDHHLNQCLNTLTQSLIKVVLPMAGAIPKEVGVRVAFPENLKRYTLPVVSRLIEAVGVEDDSSVVSAALSCLAELFDTFGPGIVPEGDFTKHFYEAVSAIITEESPAFQMCETKDQRSDLGEDALECACELIGILARVLGPVFKVEFLDPEEGANLKALMELCSPQRPDTFRAISIGCIAEIVQYVGKEQSQHYFLGLFPLIQQLLNTATRDVIHNTIFLVSEAVKSIYGNQAIIAQIDPTALNTVFTQITAKIKSRADYMAANYEEQVTHDNAISSVIHFTLTFPQQFPAQTMLPNVLPLFPLVGDAEESFKVALSLPQLFNNAPEVARQFTGPVLAQLAVVMYRELYVFDPTQKDAIVAFGKQLLAQFPQEAMAAPQYLDGDLTEAQSALSHFNA